MSTAVSVRRPGLQPEYARIASLSAAIGLNAAMLLLALRPPLTHPVAWPARKPVTIRIIPLRPLPPEPPAPPMPPRLHTPKPPVVRRIPLPVRVPDLQPTPMSIPGPVAPVVQPVAPPAPVADVPARAGPDSARLTYLHAPPPRYPVAARRAGMQGTVTLRVLVDARGCPREVVVAKGSGFPLLDRAARDKVLRDWRFVPAHVDGRPTPAWALVPVVFRLDRP